MAGGILDPETPNANPCGYGVPPGLIGLLTPRPSPDVFASEVWMVVQRLVAVHKGVSDMLPSEAVVMSLAFCRPDLLGEISPAQAWQTLTDAQRQAVTLWAMPF
jgi:hypothetical protein